MNDVKLFISMIFLLLTFMLLYKACSNNPNCITLTKDTIKHTYCIE